jgi:hypothetical protein
MYLFRSIFMIICFTLIAFPFTGYAQETGEIPAATDVISATVAPVENGFINAWESFTYPLDVYLTKPNAAGDSINGGSGGINITDVNGAGGWTSTWILAATSYHAELSETQVDTERIMHQDSLYFPGSFSLQIRTPAINGPKRSMPIITKGDLWISFIYQDTGPVEDHDSGMFILDRAGTKLLLVGKPRNAAGLGVSHLADEAADMVVEATYSDPHHLMIRIVLNDQPGESDDVYLWIDPDEDDRQNTYDVGGKDLFDAESIGGVMLSRRKDAGSGFFDDISINTIASLPPEGTVRVDLGFDPESTVRDDANIVLHDVISIDSFTDGYTGEGYGHNAEQDHFMVVRGYIYYTDLGESKIARGIPMDRLSGLAGFSIAPFNDSLQDSDPLSGVKNALRFHPESGTNSQVNLEVPVDSYGQCRILTSGDGYGELPVVFEYQDGSIQEAVFRSPDWLDDAVDDGNGGVIPAEINQINNGMNRLDAYAFFEGSDLISRANPELDDASFFSERVSLDLAKTLTAIKLGPSNSSVINVYSLLLDMSDDITPVVDWMMY